MNLEASTETSLHCSLIILLYAVPKSLFGRLKYVLYPEALDLRVIHDVRIDLKIQISFKL